MIKINGKVFSNLFSGNNNVVIVNGRKITACEGERELKTFDEKKIEDGSKIEKITIDSNIVDVDIIASNSSNVETHFYGQAESNGNIEFDVNLVKHELKITVTIVGDCYNSNFKLIVGVPNKTFKEIFVKTTAADISFSGNIFAENLKVETLSGDIQTCATFNSISANSMSGDIELCINANSDLIVDISTISGNVSADFENIARINISSSTLTGNVRNYHENQTGYSVDGDISTMSGNIRIR